MKPLMSWSGGLLKDRLEWLHPEYLHACQAAIASIKACLDE